MIVTLHKFSKRQNSTALPPANTGKNFSCQLKDETSFINPVLKFDPTTLVTGVFSPSAYNYAEINYWQRFYYITDWKYINGVWEAYLTVDVLASFRSEIGNTTAYIIRSANSYNGDIIDTFYPAKTNVSINKTSVACAWYGVAPSGGSYVLGIINYDNANKIGALNYFALTSSQLASLLNYLFTNNIFVSSSITEIGEGLYKSLFYKYEDAVKYLEEIYELKIEDIEEHIKQFQVRKQRAMEVPVSEFDIDFHKFQISFEDINDNMYIIIKICA